MLETVPKTHKEKTERHKERATERWWGRQTARLKHRGGETDRPKAKTREEKGHEATEN